MMNEELKKELIKSYKHQALSPLQRVICNAAIMAGITFFSTLSIEFPPTGQNIWAASIAGVLAMLTQLKIPDNPKRPLGMLI